MWNSIINLNQKSVSIMPLKYLVSTKITDGPHETPFLVNDGIPFLSVDAIQNGELIVSNDRMISLKDANLYGKKCQPIIGDILIGKAASTGKIALVKTNQLFSIWSPLALVRVNKLINNRFMAYFLKSNLGQEQIDFFATTNTQKNISMKDLERVKVSVPSIEKQIIISNFLDEKVATIDRLIKINEERVNNLNKYKHEKIKQTIYEGINNKELYNNKKLDPNRKIPKEWQVIKSKFVFKIFGGSTPKSDDYSLWDGDISWATPADMDQSSIFISETSRKITNKGLSSANLTLIDKKSIIISNRAPIGKVNIVNNKMCFNQGCKGLVLNEEYYYLYYYFCLLSNEDVLNSLGKGTTFMELSMTNLKNFKLPKPTYSEQVVIGNQLLKEIQEIENIIKKIKEKIVIIKEYKKSLIYEYITGKKQIS